MQTHEQFIEELKAYLRDTSERNYHFSHYR